MPDTLHVLLLAHPETDALAVTRFLEEAGYSPEVTEVRSLEELEAALGRNYALILGDPALGDMSPGELVRKLRHAETVGPFIAFSPYMTHEQGTEAVRAGAFDYFAEADLGRLPSTVHRAFRDYHTRRRLSSAEREKGRADIFHGELLRNSPEAIAVLGEEGHIIELNPAFTALFGYTTEESSGKLLRDIIVPGEKHEEYDTIAARVLRGNITRMESTRRTKDGRDVRVSAIAIPVEIEGGTEGVYVIYNDISARVRALDALRRAESNYRDFFMNAVEGMYVSTPMGRFMLVNPAMADLLEYDSPSDLADNVRSISQEIYSDPEHRDRFLEAMNKDGLLRGFKSRVRRKDGTEVDVVENVRAVHDEDGELLYYQGTMSPVLA